MMRIFAGSCWDTHVCITYVSVTIPAGRSYFGSCPACGRLGSEARSKAQRKQDGNCGIEEEKESIHIRKHGKHFYPFCLHHGFCLCAQEGV